jgi:hypothetical protein
MLIRENFSNENISGCNLPILWCLIRNYPSGDFESFFAFVVFVQMRR